jgi:hypothetical protein
LHKMDHVGHYSSGEIFILLPNENYVYSDG